MGDVNQCCARIGEEMVNYQNCLMKIIKYNHARDIIVEFQDDYMAQVHTSYYNFKQRQVKNPYYPSVCNNIGIIGNKYTINKNGKHTKEYSAWCGMLARCYGAKEKLHRPTYEDVTCCNEWLLFENFYEWLHKQSNFDKWLNGNRWAIDKDILIKGNKIYSPNTCCLVPESVNSLFIKSTKRRGDLPIGVSYSNQNKAYALSVSRKRYDFPVEYFDTKDGAFKAYKKYKEEIIKKVAKIEFDAGNITKECYNAMMKYEVEITD